MNHPQPILDALKRPLPPELADALAARFGERFTMAQSVRDHHGKDESPFPTVPPDAVVFAQSTGEVVAVVDLCRQHRYPLIAHGAGSSIEGQLLAIHGGLSLDLTGMNKVLSVAADDLTATVEPGVTRKQLNLEIRDTGLFFPIDPGADASLGGMAATRASGTNAVRYGTMRENVLSLTVVTADGKVVKTANRARKSSAGYDLTRLFIGSEGTLGIVTEITLRLQGIPEAISAGICPFPSVKAACDAVIMTIQSGIPVARIELLDELQVRAVNLHSKLTLPESPLLLLEFHGTEAGVQEQAERFGDIAAEFGGGPFDWATKPEERTRLWQARHDSYWAARGLRPGAQSVATDVCVPISRLAECVDETKRDILEIGLIAPIVGHVGDGNFHVQPLVDMDNPAEVEACEAFVDRLVKRALAMEGTCTGEHGIGQKKMKYLELEHGPAALDLMRVLKQAIDPHNIMNPGKIGTL
jgi:D-lactate dehydrogenase (cytochrome)